MISSTVVLITGANAGIGFDTARQLALKDSTAKVILACRDESKAFAAKEKLEQITGKKDMFDILIVDVSNLDSVRNAVSGLNQSINAIILNAGGPCTPNPTALNKDGVTKTMATNVLGHVLMIDELLKQNKLQEGSSILFAGSEVSRGVPSMGQPAPKLNSGSVEEFKSVIDGTFFGEKDDTFEGTYGATKLVGILWMSSMANKLSNYRFISISPGMSSGTNILDSLPTLQKMVFSTFLPLMDCMGMSHPVDKGAARYVDVLLNHDLYHSGTFYGSKRGAAGAIGDQAEISDVFSNTTYQDNANEALHMFL